MDTVFYNRFERHDHGRGLKAHATHYCAGCGHGLAHKYMAEAIEELDIQDRTIAISPVGCAVFMYYYLDVGNSQAAHGRAPAVALGHKVANPESIVISYQGDGDLASIGIAEIIQTAQMGIPISVIFINNAIYGMTGGQMAPTTLMNQRTTTTPEGRSPFTGLPMKMAELIAQLDGPIYVERVALFNNKQRFRAKRAFKKALRLQKENRGFSFVEVLSECPTHLRKTPEQAQKWVEEEMLPIFPLGVKKEAVPDGMPFSTGPAFDPDQVVALAGGTSNKIERFAAGFPTHIAPSDVGIKFAGAGGDGAQTIAKLTCGVGINEGFDATYIPSYGPESRGGTSYADVHIAAREVLSPSAPHPHILIAFNAPSLDKFGPTVREGGVIVYDETVISKLPDVAAGVRMLGIPLTRIAVDLGKALVKNVVAIGAMQAATKLLPPESFLAGIHQALQGNCALIPLNETAFREGIRAMEVATPGPVS